MKNKNEEIIKKIKRTIVAIIVVIMFLIVISAVTELTDGDDRLLGDIVCFRQAPTCFKTVCTFWGCGLVEVDIDSSSCEKKDIKCVEAGFG